MTEYEKMIRGELYDPSDPELTAMRIKARKLARKYNLTDEDEPETKGERKGVVIDLKDTDGNEKGISSQLAKPYYMAPIAMNSWPRPRPSLCNCDRTCSSGATYDLW